MVRVSVNPRARAVTGQFPILERRPRLRSRIPRLWPLFAGTRNDDQSFRDRAWFWQAYTALAKAGPSGTLDSHWRIRHDRVDTTGCVTLRHNSRLHHIGIGRTHAGTHVVLLVQDLDIRIINPVTGEVLRELTLNPDRDYQPTGAPKGPTRRQKQK